MALPIGQVGQTILACGSLSCNNAANNATGTSIPTSPSCKQVAFSGNAALTVTGGNFGNNAAGMYVPANTVVTLNIANASTLAFWGNAGLATVGYTVLG